MAERKKGQGSEKRRRSVVINARWDEAEAAALRAAADTVKLSVAAFMRKELLGDEGPRSRKTRRFNPNWNLIADIRAELGHQGANLNQLSHLAHLGDLERPAALDATLLLVAGLCKRLDGLLDDGELW